MAVAFVIRSTLIDKALNFSLLCWHAHWLTPELVSMRRLIHTSNHTSHCSVADVTNLFRPTGYVMHQQVLHSTTVYSAHTVFMCFVFIWEQTATCATYIINWLVFITEMKNFYSAVRTGSFNKAVCASSLEGWYCPLFGPVVIAQLLNHTKTVEFHVDENSIIWSISSQFLHFGFMPAVSFLLAIMWCASFSSVTIWGRLNALYVGLYIGPRVDLWVLQGVNITEGNKSVSKLVWFSAWVVNNTHRFLERRMRVELTFVRNLLVLRQDGRRETWLLFWLIQSEQNLLNRGLWLSSFRAWE
jgi:hypothetical protein